MLRGVRYRRRLGVVREVSDDVEESGLRHGRVLGVESVDVRVCFSCAVCCEKKNFFFEKKENVMNFYRIFVRFCFFSCLRAIWTISLCVFMQNIFTRRPCLSGAFGCLSGAFQVP